MRKAGVSFRKEAESPKANLQKLMEFMAPKPQEQDQAMHLDLPTEIPTLRGNLTQGKVPFFVPYSSERDNLGRLKLLSSRRSTQPETGGNRVPSLPRLQQSIYTNFKEGGVSEPLDLQNAKRFKVVDGFERQINIIIRNKEFMNFLKEEKNKKPAKSIGFLSQPREPESKLHQKSNQGACLGNYDVCFSQIWPRTQSITIKSDQKLRKKKIAPMNEPLYSDKPHPGLGSEKDTKAPDFDKMGTRRPMINYPSYKDQDSEEEEQRKLDEYFKLNCRPPSSVKRNNPSHNFDRIVHSMDIQRMMDIRKDTVIKYDLKKYIKSHNFGDKS